MPFVLIFTMFAIGLYSTSVLAKPPDWKVCQRLAQDFALDPEHLNMNNLNILGECIDQKLNQFDQAEVTASSSVVTVPSNFNRPLLNKRLLHQSEVSASSSVVTIPSSFNRPLLNKRLQITFKDSKLCRQINRQ